MLSRPFELRWAGWRAMSHELQANGWRFSVEEQRAWGTVRFAFQHQEGKVVGVTENIPSNVFRRWADHPPVLRVAHLSSTLLVRTNDTFSGFRPMDAAPQWADIEPLGFQDINDTGIFAHPPAATQEIIVDPASVAECLEMIKRIQLPEQEAIRERKRLAEAREHMKGTPVIEQLHAQVFSIV